MALTQGAFPYDLNELLGGAARVLLGPADVTAIPTDADDIFDQVQPYDSNAGWTDTGATKEAFQYARNIDVGGYQIQQVQGNVIEEVTNVARTVRVSMAQIGPEGLKIIEQSQQAVTTVAAAAGRSAYKELPFGSITDLLRYRVAFVSRRSPASGVVTEPVGAGSGKRGRYVIGVGYQVAVSADNVEMGLARGELAAAQVTFTFFPDSSKPQGAEYGRWMFEEAGTIA